MTLTFRGLENGVVNFPDTGQPGYKKTSDFVNVIKQKSEGFLVKLKIMVLAIK